METAHHLAQGEEDFIRHGQYAFTAHLNQAYLPGAEIFTQMTA